MTPPKLPRATTAHRDVRETKTPPSGVAVQIAQRTGRTPLPTAADLQRTEWDEDERTPIGGTSLESVDWRTQQMRVEQRQELMLVQDRVSALSVAVSEVAVSNAREMGAMRGEFGELKGEVTACVGAVNTLTQTLIPIITTQASHGLQQATLTTTSTLKIHEAEKLDVVDARKWRRVTFGTAIGSGGILLVLATYLMGKCT